MGILIANHIRISWDLIVAVIAAATEESILHQPNTPTKQKTSLQSCFRGSTHGLTEGVAPELKASRPFTKRIPIPHLWGGGSQNPYIHIHLHIWYITCICMQLSFSICVSICCGLNNDALSSDNLSDPLFLCPSREDIHLCSWDVRPIFVGTPFNP